MQLPSLSPRTHRLLLVAYYVGVMVALVLMYGINPLAPPQFIYQGF
jgi:hypothetical protein